MLELHYISIDLSPKRPIYVSISKHIDIQTRPFILYMDMNLE